MRTHKRTAFALGTLLVLACGAALALEVPRPAPENESVPQPPLMRSQSTRLPERPAVALNFRGQATPSPTAFEDLDRNGDGFVSRIEASDDLSTDFALWDRNADGKLRPQEFERYRADRARLANAGNARSDRF